MTQENPGSAERMAMNSILTRSSTLELLPQSLIQPAQDQVNGSCWQLKFLL